MAIRYVCTQKYFSGRKLYRVGDYAVFEKASDGPQKNGKLICFEPVLVKEVAEVAPTVVEKAPIRRPGPSVKVNTKDV